ncbi:MAG TPA: protein kinase [Polyangia bacterium]
MTRCGTCGAEIAEPGGPCPACGAAADAGSQQPVLGATIGGKFILREIVGAGAMGTVFRADQASLGRTVAVKILNAALARDEAMVRRFHAEARAASRLNHPNTISIIDFGQTLDGLLYLVMEFVRGRTLTEVIRQDFPLPQARMVEVMGQVLAGLHEAHSQGVIHQDIKPDNILVERMRTGGDLVKIADFGIARLRGEEAQAGEQVVICGTPEYMAPEQIRGQPVDGRADVYAAGVVLYEMLTGARPFDGGQTEVLRAHLNDVPVSPQVRRPDLSLATGLVDVTMRALSKDPDARFESAAEFRAEIESCTSVLLVRTVPCPACATQAPAGSLFCPRCGVRLRDSTPSGAQIDPHGATIQVITDPRQPTRPPEEDPRFPLKFVGRDEERALIGRILAARERARAMIVVGPAGVGKSRLCAEAAEDAGRAGYRVFTFKPDPTGLAAPWFPVRAAVSALLGLPSDVSRAAIQSACTAAGIDLRELPGLAELYALAAPVTGLELAVRRRECAAAALRVLRGHPSWPPTLLVFEDVERFDRPSVEVLQRLVEYLGEAPVHVLLTSVPGSEAEWMQGAELLALEGLPEAAVVEAVEAVLGTSPSAAELARRLHAEASGLPLHIEEALRQAMESGGSAEGTSFADVVDARIEALPPAARRALQAASVHGLETPTAVVAALLRGDDDAAVAIGTLVGRGLLTRRIDDLCFAHPLIQEVVYAGIPVDARREFHARVHAILAQAGAAPAVIGYHGHAAGGAERVLAALERAGLDAQQAFDDAGAMMHFQRGWEMARWMVLRGEENAEPAMARLGLVLGEAMRFAGDLVGAEGVLRETLERCGEDRAIAARVCRALAHLAANGWNQQERGHEHLRHALAHALRTGDRALIAEMYLDLAMFLQRKGDVKGAADELLEGVLLVTGGEGPTAAEGPDVLWRLVLRLSELALSLGQPQKALGYVEAALGQAQRVGSPVGAARSHVLMGDVLAMLKRPHDSAMHRVKAVEWMRNLGDRRSTAELLIALASEDAAAGAADQARARLIEAHELAVSVDWQDGIAQSGASLTLLADGRCGATSRS